MKYIFDDAVTKELIDRINQLKPDSQPEWGKMTVAQMLAHCNVTYEMAFEDIHPQPNFLVKFMLKLFVKETVVGEKPYKRNSQTAPQFIISDERDFETEKKRLLTYLQKTIDLGENHFHNKESNSFGPLSKKEWSNMFYKHLDHHLTQFKV